MALQSADVLQAMEKDAGMHLTDLKVDGGAAVNDQLLQFQADLLDTTVRRPAVIETTALGAALLAGLAVGFWDNLAHLAQQWTLDREFHPHMPAAQRRRRTRQWQRAVQRSLDWDRPETDPA